jgi:hypothetical protein
MSDPARDGPFYCCGAMQRVTWVDVDLPHEGSAVPAAWVCLLCGVWRHAVPPTDTHLRAVVEAHMVLFLRDASPLKSSR